MLQSCAATRHTQMHLFDAGTKEFSEDAVHERLFARARWSVKEQVGDVAGCDELFEVVPKVPVDDELIKCPGAVL